MPRPGRPARVEDRLIVALDVAGLDEARRLVAALDGAVSFYKLGMWLLFQPGADALVDELLRDGSWTTSSMTSARPCGTAPPPSPAAARAS